VKWGGTGLLYTCSRDRTIKVWEVDSNGRSQHKLLRTLRTCPSSQHACSQLRLCALTSVVSK